MTLKEVVGGLLLLAVFFAALILIPAGLFWSLKTLGITSGPLTAWKWLAAFVLAIFFFAGGAE